LDKKSSRAGEIGKQKGKDKKLQTGMPVPLVLRNSRR